MILKIIYMGTQGSMHKRFDHDKFAEDCESHRNIDMLISYNSDQLVRDRFTGVIEFDLTYIL